MALSAQEKKDRATARTELKKLTVSDLKKIAQDVGLVGYSSMNKAELARAIVKTRAGEAAGYGRDWHGRAVTENAYRLIITLNDAIYGDLGPYASARAALVDAKSLLRTRAPAGKYQLSNAEGREDAKSIGGVDGYTVVNAPQFDSSKDEDLEGMGLGAYVVRSTSSDHAFAPDQIDGKKITEFRLNKGRGSRRNKNVSFTTRSGEKVSFKTKKNTPTRKRADYDKSIQTIAKKLLSSPLLSGKKSDGVFVLQPLMTYLDQKRRAEGSRFPSKAVQNDLQETLGVSFTRPEAARLYNLLEYWSACYKCQTSGHVEGAYKKGLILLGKGLGDNELVRFAEGGTFRNPRRVSQANANASDAAHSAGQQAAFTYVEKMTTGTGRKPRKPSAPKSLRGAQRRAWQEGFDSFVGHSLRNNPRRNEARWIRSVDREMEEHGTVGAFTKQARTAGYDDTMEFAHKVMDGWNSGRKTVYNKRTRRQQKISLKTMRRANFAINAQRR